MPICRITLVLFAITCFISACGDKVKNINETKNTTQNIISTSAIKSVLVNEEEAYSAHWLSPHLLLLPRHNEDFQYALHSMALGQVNSTEISHISMPVEAIEKFPHLASFQAFKVSLSTSQAKSWLKSALVVTAKDANNALVSATNVQTGNVLDALYTSAENDADEVTDFGAHINEQGVSFKLWAPTAQQVKVLLFNQDKSPYKTPVIAMKEQTETGVWFVEGGSELSQLFYQYQIEVYHPQSGVVENILTTDPYSISLSKNSVYSHITDLDAKETQPIGWLKQRIPVLKNVEEYILYETHIRDFSANDKLLANKQSRGKYLAFSEQKSAGIQHLKALKKAGLNTIHLLPAFDIGTVNEFDGAAIHLTDTLESVCHVVAHISICQQSYDPKQTLVALLSSFDTRGGEAQKVISELREYDDYNWGYDPFHYTVPEGSYAVNSEGNDRIVEFRTMVKSLHNLGFRVIMDVVYNHTHQAGLANTSVLDKIVPNYYHRLDPLSGKIAQSTCCDNTATERVMMAKLMTDSLVVWARDYKIDGFRFDLMGHQPKSLMLAAREAVRAVDPDTYFYGEGWNFGEIANNQRFTQASQIELGGSEIGTFSDRLRDAVRGKGMGATGDNIRRNQGIGNGLFIQNNELNQGNEKVVGQTRQDYFLFMDQLRIGLTGNLANFPLINAQGDTVLGKDVPYGDQPTGYALDPADTINYVSKHDNQTLWDNNQYRNAFDLSTDDRVRMHIQSLSYVLFAQGIPFLHMGSEFLRSKSFLRDSYDYSDWFNGVDFSKQTNFYNRGLPPAEKDKENWALVGKVLQRNQGRDVVKPEHIQLSNALFKELLTIRASSPLFRFTHAKDIISNVSFLNTGPDQIPGLIMMKIDQPQASAPTQKGYQSIIVVFNSAHETQNIAYDNAQQFSLHPSQMKSTDSLTQKSKANKNSFTVPKLTSAVFVNKG